MILLGLALLALGLTVAMFVTRQMMLGFPCGLFWAILGGYAYTQSTTPWGDWQYFLFFASMGMVVFSIFAAYALRTKKQEAVEGDLYFDEGGDADVKFIDEGGSKDTELDDEKPSNARKALRYRAEKRRSRL